MTPLLITLPLPPSGLSPNARLHWRPKSELTKRVRGEARLAAMSARNEAGIKKPWMVLTLAATFYFPDKRRRDKSNCAAMLKAIEDGIADALSAGDDSGYTHLPLTIKQSQPDPRLELKII
jgi:crossover junction endodeoxyribonuclease RusA